MLFFVLFVSIRDGILFLDLIMKYFSGFVVHSDFYWSEINRALSPFRWGSSLFKEGLSHLNAYDCLLSIIVLHLDGVRSSRKEKLPHLNADDAL
jgi:hypothetical protein